MPSIITTEPGRLLRISPKDPHILQVSTNGGRTWSSPMGRYCYAFEELIDEGREILAITDRGLYYSTNGGRTWVFRHK